MAIKPKRETTLESVPAGTPYSGMTPDAIREEHLRVVGTSAANMSVIETIDALLYQFHLEQALSYQNEVYNQIHPNTAP